MFIRASTLLLPVITLSALVAAAPEPVVARGGTDCSNGTLQCCSQTLDATQTNANLLEGLLGIVVSPLLGPLLALNCSPITVIGISGGATCAQQAVCCQGTQFNGLVNVGCTAVNLGL
ncbi:hypothetical protein ID866_1770 [Astraeus odoratus]|nr:hypothetical protein ID866_1770 [Astraeus odoratus]